MIAKREIVPGECAPGAVLATTEEPETAAIWHGAATELSFVRELRARLDGTTLLCEDENPHTQQHDMLHPVERHPKFLLHKPRSKKPGCSPSRERDQNGSNKILGRHNGRNGSCELNHCPPTRQHALCRPRRGDGAVKGSHVCALQHIAHVKVPEAAARCGTGIGATMMRMRNVQEVSAPTEESTGNDTQHVDEARDSWSDCDNPPLQSEITVQRIKKRGDTWAVWASLTCLWRRRPLQSTLRCTPRLQRRVRG